MAREALKLTESRAVFADSSCRLRRYSLIRTGFDEFANPETARITSRKLGRQSVIRADDFVALCNIGFGPKK